MSQLFLIMNVTKMDDWQNLITPIKFLTLPKKVWQSDPESECFHVLQNKIIVLEVY